MEFMKIKRFLLSLAFTAFSTCIVADMIVLKNGREYRGKLVSSSTETIRFEQGGETVEYPRAEVVHVRLQKARKWDRALHVDDIRAPLLKEVLALPPAPEHSQAGFVTLASVREVDLKSPDLWTSKRREIIRILNERGDSASVQEVYYHKECEQAELEYAISIRPDGSIVHLSDSALQEEPLYPTFSRYDTVNKLRFAMPEGKPGVVMDYSIVKKRTEPLPFDTFYGEYLLGGSEPGLRYKVVITSAADLPLKYEVLNDNEVEVSYTEETMADGRIRRVWQREKSPLLIPEPQMQSLNQIIPRLVIGVTDQSWETLGESFNNVLKEKYRAAEKLEMPDLSAADGIPEYVNSQIQGVSVSLYASGFVPGDPAKTLNLLRGSALDRTFLTYLLLKRKSEHKVEWGWIRSQSSGEIAPSIPSLSAFGTPCLILDDVYQPIIPADDMTRPEEAAASTGNAMLLLPGKKPMKLSVPSPMVNRTQRDIHIILDDNGDASVEQNTTYYGVRTGSLRRWRRLTPVEIEQQVKQSAANLNSGAYDISFKVIGDVRKNDPVITLKTTSRVRAFADVSDLLCAFRPPWLDYSAGLVGRDERIYDFQWSMPYSEKITLTVSGPEDLRPYAVPESFDLAFDGFLMKGKTEISENDVTFTLEYERTDLKIPSERYSELKQTLEKRADIGRRYWIWRKPQNDSKL